MDHTHLIDVNMPGHNKLGLDAGDVLFDLSIHSGRREERGRQWVEGCADSDFGTCLYPVYLTLAIPPSPFFTFWKCRFAATSTIITVAFGGKRIL